MKAIALALVCAGAQGVILENMKHRHHHEYLQTQEPDTTTDVNIDETPFYDTRGGQWQYHDEEAKVMSMADADTEDENWRHTDGTKWTMATAEGRAL